LVKQKVINKKMLGIYTRLSKEDEESNSINNQLREGKRFAKKLKFDFNVYNEGEGVSGTLDIVDRPQLLKLITDIEEGTIKRVWMRNQNRLSRNNLTYAIFIDAVKKKNVDVYFGDKEKLDFNDPSTLLLSGVLSQLSEYQANLQSRATKKALKDNAKEGKAHGISPYGYTSENRYIVVQGTEAEIVKDIFQMSLEGKGTNKIAEILNKKGTLTRYNQIGTGTLTTTKYGRSTTTKKKDIRWSGNTIRNIIKNPIYKGERHLKSGVYEAPNIITPHYWQQVNDNLKANRNNSGKVVTHKYLLKGIIRCAKCDRNYYGRTRVNKKDNYYMCCSKRYKTENCGNRSINIDVIEDFVWNRFFIEKELLKLTDAFFKDIDSESKLTQIRADIRLIEVDIKENEKRRKRAIELALLDDIDDSDIASQMRQLKITKKDLQVRLRNLLDDESYYVDIDLNKENEIKDLNEIYSGASFNKKREIIQKYIREIYVFYKNGLYGLRFTYNFTVTPEFDEEVYLIDKSYNVIFEVCNKYIMPLSDKTKKMNNKELRSYADNLWDKFAT